MKKVKLIHVVTGLGFGGAEKVVLDLSSNQSEDKFEVQVYSISDNIEMLPQFEQNNIKVTIGGIQKSILGFLKVTKQLFCVCKNDNIEVLHAHMIHALIPALFVKVLIPSIKIVFTSHNINVESRGREVFIKATKALRGADILFSERQNHPMYLSDYVVIPNGVTIPKSLELNQIKRQDKVTFLCVGRLETQKNHISLPKIVDQIRNLDFQILIAGKGPLEDEIKAEIKKYNLEDKIILLGFRSDILKLVSESHVFLMPSLWEGFPISLLEAGGIGTPILTRNVGSIDSLIKEETGYLVDTDEQFTSAMAEMITDYYTALERAAVLKKEIEENYSLNKIVAQHESIYLSLLTKTN